MASIAIAFVVVWPNVLLTVHRPVCPPHPRTPHTWRCSSALSVWKGVYSPARSITCGQSVTMAEHLSCSYRRARSTRSSCTLVMACLDTKHCSRMRIWWWAAAAAGEEGVQGQADETGVVRRQAWHRKSVWVLGHDALGYTDLPHCGLPHCQKKEPHKGICLAA